ncbi:hypothetical protein IMY05_C3416000600 [Salix suchowensis]|nr:hypothetical protein IMY05_C3416000600 [Salix suchowensis]
MIFKSPVTLTAVSGSRLNLDSTSPSKSTHPHDSKQTPISKHNHMYVELVVPPSEEDRESGTLRHEWWIQRHRLSHIPHLNFGVLGAGKAMVQVFMAFPRMTHKAPYSKFWATNIPDGEQKYIWEKFITPAMNVVLSPEEQLYAGLSQDHIQFKSGPRNRRSPTYPFDSGGFQRLLKEISINDLKPCLRDNGELVLDVGITVSPQGLPLVGLWKLDAMEQSFGASGFLQGTLHRINTMANVGGEEGLYRRSAAALNEIDTVLALLQSEAATNKAYGVREEFRLGGQAMSDAAEGIKQLRLSALQEVHYLMYRRMPDNYGLLTSLIAYMMQSVVFTPPRVHTFLRHALMDLRQEEIINRFNMFFLHNFNPSCENYIPELAREDNADIGNVMGIPLRALKRRFLVTPAILPDPNTYPLGPSPTWAGIKQALATEPWKLIPRFQWPDFLDRVEEAQDSVLHLAATLFKEMTDNLWRFLRPEFKKDTSPSVKTLKEALEAWSLIKVIDRLRMVVFRAGNFNLLGEVPGVKSLSFSGRMRRFFPLKSTCKGQWALLCPKRQDVALGYIEMYWEGREGLATDELRNALDNTLSSILENCQCLPTSTDRVIWTKDYSSAVTMDTNPNFYMIHRVGGKRNGGRKRGRAAHISKREFEKEILMSKGLNEKDTAIAMKRKGQRSRKSANSRNKRVPPAPKKKARTRGPVEEEDVEMEEDSLEDESHTSHGSEQSYYDEEED